MGPSLLCVGLSVGLSVPATGSEQRPSGDVNSIPSPGALSTLSRGRQDNNKVGTITHPKTSLHPLDPPGLRPSSLHLLPLPKTENRRITHISAEQKRRFNIKLGFDTLHGLVSTLSAQPSLKVSPQPRLHPQSPFLDLPPRPDARAFWHLGPHWWHPQVSKATTLQKTAEYIVMLQQERAAMQEEAQQLRDEIEELNAAIK